jgi:hypothetical protein
MVTSYLSVFISVREPLRMQLSGGQPPLSNQNFFH